MVIFLTLDKNVQNCYNIVMKIAFYKEKVDKLLHAFYGCTHIPISLFTIDFTCLSAYGDMQQYCANIRETPKGAHACASCDNTNFAAVQKSKKLSIYTCHAGLCEVITPILYNDTVIAYLMLGRFRDEEGVYSSEEQARSATQSFDLDYEKQHKAYSQLPVFSFSAVQSAIEIVQTCICYMWSENIVSLKNNLLPKKIEDYIDEHIMEKLTVDALAKHFFLSKPTLQALFHDEFNDSVKNFILMKRLSLAKKLLSETELSVSEIAKQCGFPDYNYFSRIFHLKNSVSPSQYRKRS